MLRLLTLLLLVGLSGPVVAGDDFQREGKRDKKDPLEQKAPPKLDVSGWLNTKDGKALKLADLRGKVVVIDFWGTW